MTVCKQGDVVLIPFPFTNLSTLKQRPALILSGNIYNKDHGDVIICAVTSHVPKSLEACDHLLSDTDSIAAGLIKTSLVKCDKLITIDKRLVRKILGHVPASTLHTVIQKLQTIFR